MHAAAPAAAVRKIMKHAAGSISLCCRSGCESALLGAAGTENHATSLTTVVDRRPRRPVFFVHSADRDAASGLLCHSLPYCGYCDPWARDCFSLLVNRIGMRRFLPYRRELGKARCTLESCRVPRSSTNCTCLTQELRH